MSQSTEQEITIAEASPPTLALYRRGSHILVRMERQKGRRLGPVLNEAMQCLRRAGTRSKGFNILPMPTGIVFLEWLFASEDEARTFAEAMRPPRLAAPLLPL